MIKNLIPVFNIGKLNQTSYQIESIFSSINRRPIWDSVLLQGLALKLTEQIKLCKRSPTWWLSIMVML